MKTQFKLFGLAASLLMLISGCEKRTDFLKDKEMQAAKAPSLALRRMNSVNPYQQNFSDTSLIGLQGYKLQYQITGSYDPASLQLTCVSGCDSVVSVAAHPDSNFYAIFIKPSSTVIWHLTASNKYGQSGTATFHLTYKNSKPDVEIRKAGTNNPFGKTLHDTCSYALTNNYTLDFSYTDDNSTFSSLHVLKGVSGDNSVISVSSSQISINYGSAHTNATYVYKIFGVDPLNLTSDTCYAFIVYYNRIPSLYVVTQSGSNVTLFKDSLKTIPSPSYSLSVNISDETANISNMSVIKVTTGDNSTITKNGTAVSFNYASSMMNKTYQYKMYVTDAQGLVSDTCYFSLYVFKNRPPVFVSLGSGSLGGSIQITSSQASYYFASYSYIANNTCTVAVPSGNAYAKLGTLTINAYDPDGYNFGGYIKSIKWSSLVALGACSTGCETDKEYAPKQTQNWGSFMTNYSLQTYYPTNNWYDPASCFGTYHLARWSITLYDNDGDSTVVPVQAVQF